MKLEAKKITKRFFGDDHKTREHARNPPGYNDIVCAKVWVVDLSQKTFPKG